ncbi:MAG TPA: peptide chain release factor N(5)-glutamine methyltransferase [Pyrinomonadaceae bacterium]|nr:peptide chain release factor N(5)-glutamine methyltransferase [Pyrinomonadaceae bacterium]
MSVSSGEMMLEAAEVLRRGGVPEAHREASSLLQYVIQHDRTFLLSHPEYVLTAEEEENFRRYVVRRANGEPLQYITGTQTFFGLDFEVTKDVLIPRPETELLVETALKLLATDASEPFICDVGTGSGCIAIALLHENQRASAIGIDISETAIRVAERNAQRHLAINRLTLLTADGFSALNSNQNRFDLVVSNPPYVAGSAWDGLQREVRDHEPRVALVSGVDGLVMIRRLLVESVAFLKPGGHLLFEVGFDQGDVVQSLVDRSNWNIIDIQDDLQGIPRIVVLQKNSSS